MWLATRPPARSARCGRSQVPAGNAIIAGIMPQATAPIFGTVGSFHFRISIDEEVQPYESEAFLYGFALRNRKILEDFIRDDVRETLGSEYEAVGLHIEQGSVDIRFIVDALTFTYVTISQYDDFLKSMVRIAKQLKKKLASFFGTAMNVGAPGNVEVEVEGEWQPSLLIIETRRSLTLQQPTSLDRWFTIYLIVTNAAMLTLISWLLIRHLR
jgi:hypothetical protein